LDTGLQIDFYDLNLFGDFDLNHFFSSDL